MERQIPDVGTVPPAHGAPATVAPMVVARIGGLPVRAVDDLAAPRTMGAVREAEDSRAAAGALAPAAGEDLYHAVPGLEEDRDARRAAIALRRDVHNLRWTARTEKAVRALLPLLPAAGAGRLRQWAQAIRRHHELLDDADEVIQGEVRQAGEAMLARLREPSLAAGLALASPEFTDRLLAGSPGGLDSRLARSATSYLTRIALKTSPLSTLTTVGLTWFGRGEPNHPLVTPQPDPAAQATRDISTARALPVALLLACARTPGAAGLLDVATNGGLLKADGRWVAALPTYVIADDFAFRVDEVTDCGLYEWLAGRLPTQPCRLDELHGPGGGLSGLGPELAGRLVDMGLLQPVTPWPVSAGQVLGPLAAWVRARGTPALHPFADALGRLARCEQTIVASPVAADRVAAISTARAAAIEAFRSLGQPAPPWVKALPLFHETVGALEGAVPNLPEVVRDDLVEAARWLAPLTVPDPLYGRLVSCFVHRYGVGGTCRDLIGFLYAFITAGGAERRWDAALPGGRPRGAEPGEGPPGERPPADPDRLRGHHTVCDANHTLFFQLAVPAGAQVPATGHELVVNLLHPGTTGLAARWACIPALRDRLDAAVAGWVRELHRDCRVYQVSAYPDWADVQRPPLRTLPWLRCPGDLPNAGPLPADTSDMVLTHDPSTGTLQAYDRDGCPVAFSYQGTIPRHLLDGPVRLLCLLSDPWVTLGRLDRDRRVPGGSDERANAGFRPRVQQGRIVWARARWSVGPEDIPRPGPGNTSARFLAVLERWRREHGLPEEVFVSQFVPGPAGMRKEKPQWLGFGHPHAVWAALRQIRPDAAAIDLVEVLPARDAHWARDEHGAPVAAEFIAMVRHG
ncbi:MAG TPA: lantibiotic dehydratase [Streptosporangiaceae bacterium]|nr:lantibiotic dehydratase [Streptosporangiaceae bacterium]